MRPAAVMTATPFGANSTTWESTRSATRWGEAVRATALFTVRRAPVVIRAVVLVRDEVQRTSVRREAKPPAARYADSYVCICRCEPFARNSTLAPIAGQREVRDNLPPILPRVLAMCVCAHSALLCALDHIVDALCRGFHSRRVPLNIICVNSDNVSGPHEGIFRYDTS